MENFMDVMKPDEGIPQAVIYRIYRPVTSCKKMGETRYGSAEGIIPETNSGSILKENLLPVAPAPYPALRPPCRYAGTPAGGKGKMLHYDR
jgi:hypothetical protein